MRRQISSSIGMTADDYGELRTWISILKLRTLNDTSRSGTM